jgi:hypothetical protein
MTAELDVRSTVREAARHLPSGPAWPSAGGRRIATILELIDRVLEADGTPGPADRAADRAA